MYRFIAVLAVFPVAALSEPALLQRSGNYEVSLRLPPAGLHAGEEMEIELHIADTRRPDPLTGFGAVIRAVVEARIDMPSMPSMPAIQEMAHAESVPGDYGIHPTFAHGGSYRFRLSVKPPGDTPFPVEFVLEVNDPPDARPQRNRKLAPPRYSIEFTSTPKRPKAGEDTDLRFVFRDRNQPADVFRALEKVHEALFHLVLVRSDLAHFAHEHPQLQPDGSFLLRYRFAEAGEYRLFADVAPAGAGSQILTAKLQVAGTRGTAFRIAEASRESLRPAGNGTAVRLDLAGIPLPIRKTTEIRARVLDAATSQPIQSLENYLGAQGHFLLVHADGATFVHSHPREQQESPGPPGVLHFLARFPKAGLYRGWIQVQRDGKVLTADFVLEAGLTP